MHSFWCIQYDILITENIKEVFVMKTTKSISILLSVIMLFTMCVGLCGCGEKEPFSEEEELSSPIQTETGSSENTAGYIEDYYSTSSQESPDMCSNCQKFPVADSFSFYCNNCKCLVCNQLRKSGGNYLYCSRHNCAASGCKAMAVQNFKYCVSHKCAEPYCNQQVWSGSQYCLTHK